MKNPQLPIQVLYSLSLVLILGCSSETKTSAPVRSTQTAAPTGADSASTTDANADKKTADAKTPSTANNGTATPTPTPTPTATPAPVPAAALTLSSTAFANNGAIPKTYVAAAGGGNQSPPLQWKNPPAGTAFFVVQMVDLDFQNPAPAPFIHWLITNIPATSTQLPAAIPAGNNLAAPAEAKGANQTKSYGGPNPPALHRYELTVYAIKAGQTLTLGPNSLTNKTELEGKSLSKSTLVGTYTP